MALVLSNTHCFIIAVLQTLGLFSAKPANSKEWQRCLYVTLEKCQNDELGMCLSVYHTHPHQTTGQSKLEFTVQWYMTSQNYWLNPWPSRNLRCILPNSLLTQTRILLRVPRRSALGEINCSYTLLKDCVSLGIKVIGGRIKTAM